MHTEMILVTNYKKVDKNDFYLSNKWIENTTKEQMKEARSLQRKGELYVGYIVSAVNYAIYKTMDAHRVLINNDLEEIISCESAIIDNNHEERIAYSYEKKGR